MSYTCLVKFVLHKKRQRSAGTYISYLTQSVKGNQGECGKISNDKKTNVEGGREIKSGLGAGCRKQQKECVAVLIGLYKKNQTLVVVIPGYPLGLDWIMGKYQ